MTAALVTTCLNEAGSIDAFLDAVLAQTRTPDRIVIVDADSRDGTGERIRERISHGAPITLITAPGANRSQGRNQAIEAADCDLVAVTDVGSLPRPDWFAEIIAPLESDPEISVVSGYYAPLAGNAWQAAVCAATVPDVAEVNPETFLPSSRSVAFRRSAWEQAGGYPEWAWHNEDTPFDVAMRQAGARFYFAPEAVVEWRPETSLRRLFVQFSRYARGDAQSGLWFGHYTKAFVLLGLTVILVAGGCAAPALWLGLPGLLAAYWLRHALRAGRRTRRRIAALLAPAANLIVDWAHVVGYAKGLKERHKDGA